MSNRFLSKQHIRQGDDFDVVLKRGKRLPNVCFSLSYIKTDRDYSRLGMIVSKRHCKRAVKRNRMKRVVREQFRLRQSFFFGLDVVFLLRSSVEKMTDQEQSACVEKLFSQLIAHCNSSF